MRIYLAGFPGGGAKDQKLAHYISSINYIPIFYAKKKIK